MNPTLKVTAVLVLFALFFVGCGRDHNVTVVVPSDPPVVSVEDGDNYFGRYHRFGNDYDGMAIANDHGILLFYEGDDDGLYAEHHYLRLAFGSDWAVGYLRFTKRSDHDIHVHAYGTEFHMIIEEYRGRYLGVSGIYVEDATFYIEELASWPNVSSSVWTSPTSGGVWHFDMGWGEIEIGYEVVITPYGYSIGNGEGSKSYIYHEDWVYPLNLEDVTSRFVGVDVEIHDLKGAVEHGSIIYLYFQGSDGDAVVELDVRELFDYGKEPSRFDVLSLNEDKSLKALSPQPVQHQYTPVEK
jgi:hypothetical protein